MVPDLQCTLWPEGWWHHCCVNHDLGGTDLELFSCVVSSGPNYVVAVVVGTIMYIGVKLFKHVYKKIRGIDEDYK